MEDNNINNGKDNISIEPGATAPGDLTAGGCPPSSKKLFSSCSSCFQSDFGRVYINSTQYFDNVPETAWNFYIGGYQPAQKWLKDRKDRILTSDDIMHYKAIIAALVETQRLMSELVKTTKEGAA